MNDSTPSQALDYAPNSKFKTAPDPATTKMPKGIPFIVINEFAERYSFYGMKAILMVFMTQYMILANGTPDHLLKDQANVWNHNFTAFVYFTPILGSLIADIFWGKYRTILWISLLYCLGHGVLAMGETRAHLIIGLLLIGLGAGGIKPCVSAHVGDQFGRGNQHLLSQIYNWFYFSINLGAFIAQLMIPVLLDNYGPRVAFAIPGILMALATFMFWLGRNKFVHRPPQGWTKVRENFTGENLKILARLVLFFMFVAPFYALYDEGSGSWVDQAQFLNLHLIPGLPPVLQSQVQAINGALILLFIPVFTFGVYPLLGKFVKLTPQRKIGMGMFMMIPTFLVAWHIETGVALETKAIAPTTQISRVDPTDPSKTILQAKSAAELQEENKLYIEQQTKYATAEGPSVWWQLLAYTLLTASEIMVSIPILEFAYTQAPKKMKSIIMAAYLAGSISFGNVVASGIVTLLTSNKRLYDFTHGANRPNYYLVFVGFISIAVIIYAMVATIMPSRNLVAEEIAADAAIDGPIGV